MEKKHVLQQYLTATRAEKTRITRAVIARIKKDTGATVSRQALAYWLKNGSVGSIGGRIYMRAYVHVLSEMYAYTEIA